MRPLIVAIHGILTGQTNPRWPDKLDAWLFARDPRFKVIKKEYRAGPFPRWNCLVRAPRLAHGLAEELALFLPATRPEDGAASPIWFVAHSNGAVIALQTASRLIEQGCGIGGLILLGAACPADIERNDVLEWLRGGRLGIAVAFCTHTDRVLARFGSTAKPSTRGGACRRLMKSAAQRLWATLIWPYGGLGSTGWLLNDRPAGDRYVEAHSGAEAAFEGEPLVTYWFRGGHSTYFSSAHIETTFTLIHRIVARRTIEPRLITDSKSTVKTSAA